MLLAFPNTRTESLGPVDHEPIVVFNAYTQCRNEAEIIGNRDVLRAELISRLGVRNELKRESIVELGR